MEGISADLERLAFHAPNGELGWSRDDARDAVAQLGDRIAILGGEVWYVPEGQRFWTGLIPQRDGDRPGVYSWTAEREPGEDWPSYVERSRALAIGSIEHMPGPDDLPDPLPGRILYNLTWASDAELETLERQRARSGGRREEKAEPARDDEPAAERRGIFARLFGRH